MSLLSLSTHTHTQVQRLVWHPSAANVLGSSGGDNVIMIWNTKSPDAPLFAFDALPDQINCFSWSYNGSLMAVTCKDKKLRVYDVRKGTILQVNKYFLYQLGNSACKYTVKSLHYIICLEITAHNFNPVEGCALVGLPFY